MSDDLDGGGWNGDGYCWSDRYVNRLRERIAALEAENERLWATLREGEKCTTEHGGAARFLKLVKDLTDTGENRGDSAP